MKDIIFITVLVILATAVKADECAGQDEGYHLPHEKDCGKFYVCHDNVKNEKNCKPGLHFSRTALYCMLPSEAGCENGATDPPTKPPGPTDTPTKPPGPTDTPTKPPGPTDRPTKPPGPTDRPTRPQPGPGNCKGQPLGKRIHYPDDCSKFIVCIGGGVTMDCSEGEHFNAELEVCDFKERANCPWA